MAALVKTKYMPLSEANVNPERVATYDGQHITLSSCPGTTAFTMGNYLGGGIAGVVYEAFDQRMKRPVAVKILNPVGYKLTSPSTLRRGEIIKQGVPILGHVRNMTLENVYWVHLPRRKDLVACYVIGGNSTPPVLRELTLEMCVNLWLLDHQDDELGTRDPRISATRSDQLEDPIHDPAVRAAAAASTPSSTASNALDQHNEAHDAAEPKQAQTNHRLNSDEASFSVVPALPAKYRAFLQARQSIYREIAHMHKLTGNTVTGERIGSGHENVLQLYDVLELVQPSKSTIFLVLELAYGGELFDRIRGDSGVDEAIARHYFTQLLAGVRYCHQLGIVHRDLKPENLLLSDSDVLKIADFGLSAHFIAAVSSGASPEDPQDNEDSSGRTNLLAPARFRRLNSIVGSPHYVAPEVLHNARYGYDGRKADMWSSGVILYGLLVGTLPFGRELATCPRYLKFSEWLRSLPTDPHTGKLVYDVALFSVANKATKPQLSDLSASSFHTSPSRLGRMLPSSSLRWSPNQATDLGPSGLSNGKSSTEKCTMKAVSPTLACSRRAVAFPSWFFPSTLSPCAVYLLASLLHPDPNKRISCEEACKSNWVLEL